VQEQLGWTKGFIMSNDAANHTRSATRTDVAHESVVAEIVRTLQGLQYGVVSIVVQDGVVVQIERTEKHRLRRGDSRPDNR
jgi:hypothetical protein